MAVANFPFYSTSYGEGFGYNEREGSNTNSFRSRYSNQGYMGTSGLGPVRFNSTAAASTIAAPRPSSSQQLQRTQPLQPVRPLSAAASDYTRQQQPQQQQQQLQQSAQFVPPQEQQYYQDPSAASSSSRFSQSARFNPNAAPSVNAPPYYYGVQPDFAAPPNRSYAPPAEALGNSTYVFRTEDPNSYAFSSTFRNTGPVASRPVSDPGQQIPFGRLQAADAREVRMKMSMDSWDTFHVAPRGGNEGFNLTGLRQAERRTTPDQQSFCKESISKRLVTGEQLKYHLPGYMGYIRTSAFRHGATYGKTTRQAIANAPVN